MSKIESLTAAQIARFPEFVKKWTEIGLSTQPANRKEAEDGVCEAYRIAGIKKPRIVWCGSPLSQGLARALVAELKNPEVKIGASVRDSVWASVWASVRASVGASVRDSVRASVGASVWASVRDSVRASVRASVGASVRDSVGASVWDSVWDSVRASVGASVRDSVGASVLASVGASVRDSVGASVRASVGASGYGQHDANWLAFYEYFREVCSLDAETQNLRGLWKIAKNAGWFLPHEKICWISERPNKLNRDERGRLHSENDAAIAYPDGWEIFAWHGVRVAEYVIRHPGQITVKDIEQESNAEIRRVKMERFGQDKYLRESHAELQHRDEFGKLWRKQIPNDEDLVMVEVLNSTPEPDGSSKTYFLRVPPSVQTAKEAVAWTMDKKPNDYAPVQET